MKMINSFQLIKPRVSHEDLPSVCIEPLVMGMSLLLKLLWQSHPIQNIVSLAKPSIFGGKQKRIIFLLMVIINLTEKWLPQDKRNAC